MAVALLAVVGLGLGSRSGHAAIPMWIADHAGDALWSVCAFVGFAWIRPDARSRSLCAAALITSFSVEVSQMVEVDWLDELRRTVPGRLLLGQGWQWLDLPRYVVGVLLAVTADALGVFGAIDDARGRRV